MIHSGVMLNWKTSVRLRSGVACTGPVGSETAGLETAKKTIGPVTAAISPSALSVSLLNILSRSAAAAAGPCRYRRRLP